MRGIIQLHTQQSQNDSDNHRNLNRSTPDEGSNDVGKRESRRVGKLLNHGEYSDKHSARDKGEQQSPRYGNRIESEEEDESR